MIQGEAWLGNTPLREGNKKVEGKIVRLKGEDYYRISNVDAMEPFLMSIVSHSDHWMFISSNGALTAGRRNPETSLFPYTTDDKIHDSAGITGSLTLIRVLVNNKVQLWEPFSPGQSRIYNIERNLFKSVHCNKIRFEEINKDLGLIFRYTWSFSEKYGFVRRSSLENKGDKHVIAAVLDGIQNIMPYGVDEKLQNERSTLVDAYKKNELMEDAGIGIFSLSSIPVDKAEPSEALRATSSCYIGPTPGAFLLCTRQVSNFREHGGIETEVDIRAERGAFLPCIREEIAPGKKLEWYLISELQQGPLEIARLNNTLSKPRRFIRELEEDITNGTLTLIDLVGSSDGILRTEQPVLNARHFSNTLFNIMRGGVFANNYNVEKSDLLAFIKGRNKTVFSKHKNLWEKFPALGEHQELVKLAINSGDDQVLRLIHEYLPLMFSRRHGDPSRPWNRFSIELKDQHGKKNLYYQGNWRDIFQNWEALALSWPDFNLSMIAKFLNASTADGYNPYRITRDGIDWETIEPDDPWSYIGYWSDHQIIYLLKLLEQSKHFHPDQLSELLDKRIFSYANVPYRIKAYEALLKNPWDTVDFDQELHEKIEKKEPVVGSDARLICGKDDQPVLGSLAEKLLLYTLVKLSNFVPGGGIWMNTQRPEWNDANNALVGRGMSMVTLYYLRRYQNFLLSLIEPYAGKSIDLNADIATFLIAVLEVLNDEEDNLSGPIDGKTRKRMLDGLGTAGSVYRTKLYQKGLDTGTKKISFDTIIDFLKCSLKHIDHSIAANKRQDGLYHAYNLLQITSNTEIEVGHLYEMLEGQVAVLSSGYLSPADSAKLLAQLRQSAMFREDQHSYLLYPDRLLKRFDVKNLISQETFREMKIPKKLISNEFDGIIQKDEDGNLHFNPKFRNARILEESLERSDLEIDISGEEKDRLLELYESVFDHKTFTGRSGTFFGYEGLGCIYWHMVSKLMLAALENCRLAFDTGDPNLARLAKQYNDIREGIGFNKTPLEYGAFPTDAYSHTPGNKGAQQPGMTGQVKEDVLSLFGELGVRFCDSSISFQPFLIDPELFLKKSAPFTYTDLSGRRKTINIKKDHLAFTFCQVPVIYRLGGRNKVRILKSDGEIEEIKGMFLDRTHSLSMFSRKGNITALYIDIDRSKLV